MTHTSCYTGDICNVSLIETGAASWFCHTGILGCSRHPLSPLVSWTCFSGPFSTESLSLPLTKDLTFSISAILARPATGIKGVKTEQVDKRAGGPLTPCNQTRTVNETVWSYNNTGKSGLWPVPDLMTIPTVMWSKFMHLATSMNSQHLQHLRVMRSTFANFPASFYQAKSMRETRFS